MYLNQRFRSYQFEEQQVLSSQTFHQNTTQSVGWNDSFPAKFAANCINLRNFRIQVTGHFIQNVKTEWGSAMLVMIVNYLC